MLKYMVAPLLLISSLAWAANTTPVIPPSAAGRPAPPPRQTAAKLFSQFDLSRPDCREIARLIKAGQPLAALSLWRDHVVQRLREHDFGHYGWHEYARNRRCTGPVDVMVGLRSRQDYLNSGVVGFVDIYGMGGPGPINWYVNPANITNWGNPALNRLDPSVKATNSNYANFAFAKSFVARYWETGKAVYLQKTLSIMADFSRNHSRGFWDTYFANQGLSDQFVRQTMHCDWRLNTNALGVGWRMKNFLQILAGFAKCLGPDKAKQWADVLAPTTAPLTRAQFDRISAPELAEIAMCLERDHVSKLIWFTLHSGSVPNQRAEGLKALVFFSAIFPEFKTHPELTEYIERAYDDYLSGNFAPDGGSLEQSFNYNVQDKQGLEEILKFYGSNPPRFAREIKARVAARKAVDDALQTPLGGLPQVGNSHDVLGKDVWSSEAAAQKYLATPLNGKQPVRPQPYTSIALPYSGYYAMRSGWGLKDLYLFFMNGRPQAGHSMRDNNAIQVTAYGRQLLVCGGDPTYGVFRTPEAKGADFFLSEASSLKNNTVIVDGHSQSKNGPRASRAYQTPVHSRWYTSPRCDLVDGLYNLGYGEFRNGRDVDIDMSVQHYRRVIFIKPAKLWLVEDRMIEQGDQPHEYTQVWNFLPYCENSDYSKCIAGFKENQFELDPAHKRLRTTDPAGPNLQMLHFGPQVNYRKYYGDRQQWLGWYAAGIGDARPTVNIHVNWQSTDRDTLLTLLVPLDKGEASPIRQATEVASNKAVAGLDTQLADGMRLRYETADKPRKIDFAPVSATAGSLLVCSGGPGGLWGVAMSCTRLAVNGQAEKLPTEDFEFTLGAGGKLTCHPIFIPEVPVIARPKAFLHIADAGPLTITGARPGYAIRYALDGADPTVKSALYTAPVRLQEPCTVKARFFHGSQPLPLVATCAYQPWQWPLRQPDLNTTAGLTPGLHYDYYEHQGSIRIYDLMLRKPQRQGTCAGLDLSLCKSRRLCGVKWTGYLKVPRDGVYHFYLATDGTATVFIVNPKRDLQLPALARCGWWGHQATGDAALAAGLHRIEVQYMRGSGNHLSLEIEGPGLPRQPLPQGWLYRSAP